MTEYFGDGEQYILELEDEVKKLREENHFLKEDNQGLLSLKKMFAKAFDNHPIPMAITTLEGGCYEEVNESYAKSLGFGREEMIGKNSLELGIWIDPEHAKFIGEQLIDNNLSRCFESQHRNKFGDTGNAITYFNIIDIDGQKHVITSVVDITEAKKTEESLKLSEEKFFKAFYDNQTSMTISRLCDGLIIDVNQAYLETMNFKKDEVIGKTAHQLGIWINNEDRKELIEELLEYGHVKNREYTVRRGNGDIYHTITSLALLNLNGEKYILNSSADITKRKEAEKDLIRTQKLLYQVFDNIPQSLIIRSNRDGKIIEVNKEFLEKNRVIKSEVIGQKYLFQHAVANPEEVQRCYEALGVDGLIRNLEVSFKSIPRGEARTALLNAVPIDWMGEDCMLIVSNDITELRSYHNELSRLASLNLIGQMAGSIAHEVRNPMTAIKGYLQLFHEQYKYREDKESIELMIEELDRVNEIISQFLSISQMNTIELKLISLNQNVKNLLPLITADAIKNDVYIQTDLSKIPKIMLDKGEFRQLLLNLAHNGIQAMSKGGILTIRTFKDDHGVHLVVHDEGKGIPPEILDRIGTPFLTTKKNGTGLGMTVCYSIAERHNAKITIDTSSEGTSFKVTFPVD